MDDLSRKKLETCLRLIEVNAALAVDAIDMPDTLARYVKDIADELRDVQAILPTPKTD